MALKLAEEQAQRKEDEEKEDEAINPMKLLEKRTEQSKQHIKLLNSLEDLMDLNRRQQAVNYDKMLEEYDTEAARQKITEEQEEELKTLFSKKRVIELTAGSDDIGASL